MELKNSEHYNDPTPYEAHKNIRKEEQLEAARMRTISALVSVRDRGSGCSYGQGFREDF